MSSSTQGNTFNEDTPLVTVVVPTFNRAGQLGRAVGSVLAQTYQTLEVIIVDDCSTDQTQDVVETLQRDPRVKYLRHERNRGGSAARNTAIAAAIGDIIAFQDSDDEWLPGKLLAQVEALRAAPPSAGAVFTGFRRFGAHGNQLFASEPDPQMVGQVLGRLAQGNFIATPTLIVRRKNLLAAGGFDENLPRFQDWELWFRLAQVCEFVHLPYPWVNVYVTPSSISADANALAVAYEIMLEKHQETIRSAAPDYLPLLQQQAGHALCIAGKASRGRGYLIQSWVGKPSSKALLRYILSFMGGYTYRRIFSHLGPGSE